MYEPHLTVLTHAVEGDDACRPHEMFVRHVRKHRQYLLDPYRPRFLKQAPSAKESASRNGDIHRRIWRSLMHVTIYMSQKRGQRAAVFHNGFESWRQ